MQKGYTHISFVLDASSSMSTIKKSTIEGVNSFLYENAKFDGKATFSLTSFDSYVKKVYDFVDIKSIEPLTETTYITNGMTALYDAICMEIDQTGDKLSAIPESLRPEKVLFVILTDGEENSSKLHGKGGVQERISNQSQNFKWTFVFLGANQDAILSASELGINAINTMTFSAKDANVSSTYGSLTANTIMMRNGTTNTVAFSDADRAQATQ